MDLVQYFEDLNSSLKKALEPQQMLEIMAKFFSSIHNATEADCSSLLSTYSLCQQLESFGFDSKPVRLAIKARVVKGYYECQYIKEKKYEAWLACVNTLNVLLRADDLGAIR
jgi:hypothetical protein